MRNRLDRLRHQILPYLLNKYFSAITLFGTSLFYGVILLFLLRVNLPLALKTCIALFIIEVICAVIKLTFPTNRPIASTRQTLLEHYEASSFPSIHSARVTILVLLTYYLFSQDLVMVVIATCLALAVAYSRIHLKLHYPSDVFAGIALGFVVGRFVLSF